MLSKFSKGTIRASRVLIPTLSLLALITGPSLVASAQSSQSNTFVWVLNDGDRIGKDHLIKMTVGGEEQWRTQFGSGRAIGVDPRDGNVWASEGYVDQRNTNQLVKLNFDGIAVRRVQGYGSGAIGVNANDGGVWVRAPDGNVAKLNADGLELLRVPGFDAPASIAVDPNDNSVWIADGGGAAGRKVVKLDSNGQEQFRRNTPGFYSNAPQQIGVDPRDGSAWHSGFGDVFKLSASGAVLAQVGGFDRPTSVAIDARDGSVWVTDFSVTTSGAVVKLDQDGNELLRKDLGFPPHVAAVNPEDGSVWVSIDDALIILSSDGQVLDIVSADGIPRAIVFASPANIDAPDSSYFQVDARMKGKPNGVVQIRYDFEFALPEGSDGIFPATEIVEIRVAGELIPNGVKGSEFVISIPAGSFKQAQSGFFYTWNPLGLRVSVYDGSFVWDYLPSDTWIGRSDSVQSLWAFIHPPVGDKFGYMRIWLPIRDNSYLGEQAFPATNFFDLLFGDTTLKIGEDEWESRVGQLWFSSDRKKLITYE